MTGLEQRMRARGESDIMSLSAPRSIPSVRRERPKHGIPPPSATSCRSATLLGLLTPDSRPLLFYSRSLPFQQFGANVLEYKRSALDSNLARQYRIFVFDAHDALEASIHVGFYHILPEFSAVAISYGAEDH